MKIFYRQNLDERSELKVRFGGYLYVNDTGLNFQEESTGQTTKSRLECWETTLNITAKKKESENEVRGKRKKKKQGQKIIIVLID